jgi:hypothetical protein
MTHGPVNTSARLRSSSRNQTLSRWPGAAGDPRLIAHILGRRPVFASETGNLDAAFADNQEAILSPAPGDK